MEPLIATSAIQPRDDDIEGCMDEAAASSDPVGDGGPFHDFGGCSPQELKHKNPRLFAELVRRSRGRCESLPLRIAPRRG